VGPPGPFLLRFARAGCRASGTHHSKPLPPAAINAETAVRVSRTTLPRAISPCESHACRDKNRCRRSGHRSPTRSAAPERRRAHRNLAPSPEAAEGVVDVLCDLTHQLEELGAVALHARLDPRALAVWPGPLGVVRAARSELELGKFLYCRPHVGAVRRAQALEVLIDSDRVRYCPARVAGEACQTISDGNFGFVRYVDTGLPIGLIREHLTPFALVEIPSSERRLRDRSANSPERQGDATEVGRGEKHFQVS
jgi:hypothetical protein